MPLVFALPPADKQIDIHTAAVKATHFARYLSYAAALEMRGECRPHWLSSALRELEGVVDRLALELTTSPAPADDDPIDQIFARLNAAALGEAV